MNRSNQNRALISERFFAELCAQKRLKGFVFHSPKVTNDPKGEREAGDVVIWVRDLIIVFEITWKSLIERRWRNGYAARCAEGLCPSVHLSTTWGCAPALVGRSPKFTLQFDRKAIGLPHIWRRSRNRIGAGAAILGHPPKSVLAP